MLYEDIEQIIEFITEELHFIDGSCRIRKEDLVLLGHSLGSAPSVHIASNPKHDKISGLILFSPICSGIQIFRDDFDPKNTKRDIFCNISKAPDIKAPVFLIHGMKDNVIPIKQSRNLAKKMKRVIEWYPSQGDHSNIISNYRSAFFSQIRDFLENLLHYSHSLKRIDRLKGNHFKVALKGELNLIEDHFEENKYDLSKKTSRRTEITNYTNGDNIETEDRLQSLEERKPDRNSPSDLMHMTRLSKIQSLQRGFLRQECNPTFELEEGTVNEFDYNCDHLESQFYTITKK